jgi:hypothetical protein
MEVYSVAHGGHMLIMCDVSSNLGGLAFLHSGSAIIVSLMERGASAHTDISTIDFHVRG